MHGAGGYHEMELAMEAVDQEREALRRRVRELEEVINVKNLRIVLQENDISALEALARDMYEEFRYTPNACQWDVIEQFGDRMRELGIEVGE